MKRRRLIISLVIAGLGLGGCITDSSNTLTVVRAPDGTTTTIYELTNDGLYYKSAADYAEKRTVDCQDLDSDKCTIAILANALADKGFVPRGMSGIEAFASVGNSFIAQAPVIGLGVAAYKLATRPSSINIAGDGNTYAPFESHITGSRFNDGNTVSIPYRHGSVETITEMVP